MGIIHQTLNTAICYTITITQAANQDPNNILYEEQACTGSSLRAKIVMKNAVVLKRTLVAAWPCVIYSNRYLMPRSALRRKKESCHLFEQIVELDFCGFCVTSVPVDDFNRYVALSINNLLLLQFYCESFV